ncbi:hypothetical protein [Paenarthrobacter sp. C1]|uniref:hypothetical protein n=1 Tax=Paenarthrobacter sp. C1 TaxID=3400220 RepID=UPI003BF5BA9B
MPAPRRRRPRRRPRAPAWSTLAWSSPPPCSPRGLDDAVAVVEGNLGPSARLLLRRAHGSQDSAFAASLPLGLVLPKHLRVPEEIREAM